MKTLLFFDDYSLGVRENVERRVGKPELIPESAWQDRPEINVHWGYPGVFYEPAEGLWRMAYQGRLVDTALADRWGMTWCKLVAESPDGLSWKPRDTRKIAEVPGRLFAHHAADGTNEWSGIYLDERAPASERVKKLAGKEVWASPDGLRWKHLCDWRPDRSDAPMCAAWNGVFGEHFIYGRPGKGDRRWTVRRTRDWKSFSEPLLVMHSDGQDEKLTDLYGMPVIPYEGMFIGLAWLYHGAAQFRGTMPYKFTGGKVDCQLAYSLNGITFQRTLRETFIGNGEIGSPTGSCVYPTCLVERPDTGDLWIYASASTTEHAILPRGAGWIVAYRLRRDGFVYLESRSGIGRLATKPLYWGGGELKANIKTAGSFPRGRGAAELTPWQKLLILGGVRVQVSDPRGNPLEGYTFDECRLFHGDSLAWRPSWSSGRKMGDLAGRIIQLEIEMNSARLYALRGDFEVLNPYQLHACEETGRRPAPRPGF